MQLQLKKYDVPDYGARATAALKVGKWSDAMVAMQGVRAHGQVQRQGTLQRWVRDCGFIDDDALRLRLLDLVVRCGELICVCVYVYIQTYIYIHIYTHT
jgi:hypothetical protein